MAMVHTAMFDAVNAIEPRYRPYIARLPASAAMSKEAAATAAAAAIMMSIDPKVAEKVKALRADYLASIPDGPAKADGIKVGEAAAANVRRARANDGADAPDEYRPRTSAGVYIPTAITAASSWPAMKPFVLASCSRSRTTDGIAAFATAVLHATWADFWERSSVNRQWRNTLRYSALHVDHRVGRKPPGHCCCRSDFRATPSRCTRRASSRRARSRRRHGRHLVAVVNTSPLAVSYHHFC
jgi:hypothetical protein